MKRYPSQHGGAHTGPGRSIQLLEQSSPRRGLVLDLGCGRAPVADQVRQLGLEYVGVDVDAEALAEVHGRGYETHRLDLAGTTEQLASTLHEIVGERSLSAILAVDVLEHLAEPGRVLHALRSLPVDDVGCSLIVSIPNVTHLDIASKLLIGRWDLTEFGLLDDTHLRFFSERLFRDLFRATGWQEVDAADVVSPLSDQLFPIDAPVLRPGTPARELLHHLSAQSHPHGATYQFVRRFLPAEVADAEAHRWAAERESDEERVFASVLIRHSDPSGPGLSRVLSDLETQSSRDFETIVLTPQTGVRRDLPDPHIRVVGVAPGEDPWNAGIAAAQGRYLCFIDETVRVSPRWIEAFQSRSELVGQVLMANVASVSSRVLFGERNFESLVASGKPFPVNPLDLMHPNRPRPTILTAYAVPLEAARAAGVRFEQEHGTASPAVFLSRSGALCGVAPVADVTVAVSDARRRDGRADLHAVAEALDRAPMILPAGSATRIIELQRFRWRLTRPQRIVKLVLGRLRGLLKERDRPTLARRP